MNNKISQLEFLPNEILLFLFKYFDAQDLFEVFFNLNTRFNDLLQSGDHLSLTISKHSHTPNENENIVISHIGHLIIEDEINIDLTRFTNIRCLILMHTTYHQIKELNNDILPQFCFFFSIKKTNQIFFFLAYITYLFIVYIE